ncbi:MAG: DNA polymerase IV, partial [Fusobacteriaceae bacterium]
MRLIMHYDMDSFYASIEERENPKLKNKPFVVGGGVICTSSYEARKYGVRSAQPVFEAKKLCPGLIVIPINMELYEEVSNLIQSLVLKITYRVEFIAKDEGYIDLTGIIENNENSKIRFGTKFQKRIKEITGLSCSVGIGYNKLTAKIASDVNKPAGLYIFNNEKEFKEYIGEKPIKIIPGVGKKFGEELLSKGIENVNAVRKLSYIELNRKYGNSRADMLYYYSRGIDDSPVDYIRKTHSIGSENTYRDSLQGEERILLEFDQLFKKIYDRMMEEKTFSKTINIKIRYSDFKTITRSASLGSYTNSYKVIRESLDKLISELEDFENIRLVGFSLSNLSKNFARQLK